LRRGPGLARSGCLAEVAVVGVFGGNHQALPLSELVVSIRKSCERHAEGRRGGSRRPSDSAGAGNTRTWTARSR